MADSSIDSNASTLTRLVRAAALLTAQGASIGLAIDTLRLWTRLDAFVATNKMSAAERSSVLRWLLLPAVVWVTFALAMAAMRSRDLHRLASLERTAFRSSWAIALGLLPVLFHPTLWKTRTLMFLLTTGIATLVVWWAVRVTQRGLRRGVVLSVLSDFGCITAYLKGIVPLKLRVLAPLLVIGVVVLYVVTHGVWLDPTAVPKGTGDPPVTVHSLRQAFLILGHGGWLGVPIAMLKFLRPPGHAHIFFWALCVSSAAFPLYIWTKGHLGAWIALIVSLIYLSLPALRTVGRSDVLPLGVAAGLFFLATIAWERKRFATAIIISLLTVGVHEQATLWFICLGVYLAGFRESAALGHRLALGSAIYFAVVALLILPQLGFDPYHDAFHGLWGNKAVGLVETLKVALTNPVFVLTRWLDLQGLEFWLALFVPFAFLPIAGRNWLLWVMPGVLFAIVAPGRIPSIPASTGATAHFIVLGFAASITTLARLRIAARTRHHANAALVAWVFALVPCAYQLGGIWLPAL
jgi:hypothetical protein